MTKLERITDLDQLESLRFCWQEPLRQMRAPAFFHSLDWHLAYWHHYAPNERPEVLVIRDDRTILGILPLTRRKVTMLPGITGPAISVQLATPTVDGAFCGPIGRHVSATITSVLQRLVALGSTWDELRLDHLNPWTDVGRAETAMQFRRLPYQKTAGAQWTVVQVEDLSPETCPQTSGTYREERVDGFYQYDDDPRWNTFDRVWPLLAPNATSCWVSFWEAVHRRAAHYGVYEIAYLESNGNVEAAAYGLRHGLDCYWSLLANTPARRTLVEQILCCAIERGDRRHFFPTANVPDLGCGATTRSANGVSTMRQGRLRRVAGRIRQWLLPSRQKRTRASTESTSAG